MEVKQIHLLMNEVTEEILGEKGLVLEDLSNIVDIGTSIFDATKVDNYVRTLVDHIGKVVFVNRPYTGSVPSVLMDAWEFGSVLEKIQCDIPDATENESWELQNGTSYDPNIFYKPSVSAKFFNSKVTFEIPVSITDKQVRESFDNPTQLNSFLSMIYNAIDKSMAVKTDALIMRTINAMTASTINNEYAGGEGLATKSGVRAVNLLYLYNQKFTKTLTAGAAITDPDFIRFASYEMGLYKDRLAKISTLFNIGGKERFTPADMLHFVLLSDFAKSADIYLQSDVYHNELTKLAGYETVAYWQGSGTDYAFDSTSKINVTVKDNSTTATIEASGILGVMFDRDALGVSNLNRRVTSNYNAKAEFTNNWFKADGSYFNDQNENFVVFFVA